MLRLEVIDFFFSAPRTANVSFPLDSCQPPFGGESCGDRVRQQICGASRSLRFKLRVFSMRSGRGHKSLSAKRGVQRERQLASVQTRRVSFCFHWSLEMHYPGVTVEIEALCGHANGFLRTSARGLSACRAVCGWRQQGQAHILQEPHGSFLGAILDSYRFAAPILKDELHRLVGLRHPGSTVKGHATRFHVHLALRRSNGVLRRAFRIRSALDVKLYCAAANDPAARVLVLAALGMHGVVTRSGLPEDRDLHVLQETRVLTLEIRHL